MASSEKNSKNTLIYCFKERNVYTVYVGINQLYLTIYTCILLNVIFCKLLNMLSKDV